MFDNQPRLRDGRYTHKRFCQGCGKPIGDDYASHQMTDCTGDDGECWGDVAIALCDPCVERTAGMRNASEFRAYAASPKGRKR